jgi:chromosome segregation ATPase
MKKKRKPFTAKTPSATCVVLCCLLVLTPALPALGQQKDYLSATEADKIRDADSTNDRIKLFLSFAADRLKKLEYELARPSSDRRRAERLNNLLNAYISCVDDAAELIDLGREKQEDIRDGIKQMQSRAKDFLSYLEKLAAGGAELKAYQSTLDDAILGTKEALEEAEKAAKEYAPPPVRRKP